MWYNSFLSAGIQLSRAQRRHLSTVLRLASRALMKGKRNGVGNLGNGASVAAVLSALGVITFSGPAHGQFAAGGATALTSTSVDVMGDRITGGTLVCPGGNTSTSPTGVAVGDASSKAISGSVVFGFHDVAGVSGQFPGVALGIENQAFGTFAVAVGTANNASGLNAAAFGVDVTASGSQSLGAGRQAIASCDNSVALGMTVQATALNTIAIGNSAKATGVQSIAIGGGTNGASGSFDATAPLASGASSIAVGVTANAAATDGVAIGGQSTVAAAATSGLALGKGAAASVGINTVAIGVTAAASNTNAAAIGFNAAASGTNSLAVGNATKASAANTTVLGSTASASLANSVALGFGSTATAVSATATWTGIGTVVTGKTFTVNQAPTNGVVALGLRQIQGLADGEVSATSKDAVSGSQLFAVGQSITASMAKFLHQTSVLADTGTATGTDSVAIGPQASSNGVGALAEGRLAQASAAQSTAIGGGEPARSRRR